MRRIAQMGTPEALSWRSSSISNLLQSLYGASLCWQKTYAAPLSVWYLAAQEVSALFKFPHFSSGAPPV